MESELNRTATYTAYPTNAPIRPQKLAKHGFYFSSKTGRVMCYACGKGHDDLMSRVNILVRHLQLSPLCPLLGGTMLEPDPAVAGANVSPVLSASKGLTYTGKADYVKCMHCNIQFTASSLADDPKIRKAVCLERCPYAMLMP